MGAVLTTGSSSVELSRNAKGDYAYSIKVYFSGNTTRALLAAIKRLMTGREEIEKCIAIAEADDVCVPKGIELTDKEEVQLIKPKPPERKKPAKKNADAGKKNEGEKSAGK